MRKWDYNVERGREGEKQGILVTNEGRGKSNEEDGESKEADKGMEKKKALEDESEGEKLNKKD